MSPSKFNLSFGTAILALVTLTTPLFAQFAYVVNNGSHDVSGYKVNANGSLTALSGSPFPAGNQPTSIAVDPSGSFAYVTNSLDATVSEYKINAGALVQNGSVFAGTQPTSLTVDRTGHCVFVANAGSSNISQYKIAASGKLIPNGAFNLGLGSIPDWVVAHPNGDALFVADKGTTPAYALKIANCMLSLENSASVNLLPPVSVTLDSDPKGQSCLYFAEKSSDKVGARYANTIPMTNFWKLGGQINGFPIVLPAGSQPQSVTALRPPGAHNWFAYVADNGSNKISGYKVNNKCGWDGQITGSPFAAGSGPTWLAIDPTRKFAYVVNEGDNNIWEYKININGSLSFSGSKVLTGASPVEIVIH